MSREAIYSPMGQKTCTTTTEEMFEKLHSRTSAIQSAKVGETAKPDSDEFKATGPDQSSPPGLVWSEPQKGLGFVYIDSGKYRITRQNKKYECHHDCYYLGSRANSDDAKALCEEHFKQVTDGRQ